MPSGAQKRTPISTEARIYPTSINFYLYYIRNSIKWFAYALNEGKQEYIGVFKTKEDAICAKSLAEQSLQVTFSA